EEYKKQLEETKEEVSQLKSRLVQKEEALVENQKNLQDQQIIVEGFLKLLLSAKKGSDIVGNKNQEHKIEELEKHLDEAKKAIIDLQDKFKSIAQLKEKQSTEKYLIQQKPILSHLLGKGGYGEVYYGK